MEFYVDIADIESVKKVEKYYPIDGFTTNPAILTRTDKPLDGLFSEYKAYLENTNKKIFVQVTAQKAENMSEQAKKLKEYFCDNLVVKLPATKEGYSAIPLVKRENIPVCLTVVHSSLQGLMAAKAGADYIAPYVSHIDNIGADGIKCCEEITKAVNYYGYSSKVLGASFRTADQILRLMNKGIAAVTITPQMFDMLTAHPSTNESMKSFSVQWKLKYGDKEVTDFIK